MQRLLCCGAISLRCGVFLGLSLPQNAPVRATILRHIPKGATSFLIAALCVSSCYIPYSKPRALDKGRGLPADAIIFRSRRRRVRREEPRAQALGEALASGGYEASRMNISHQRGWAPHGRPMMPRC